MLGTVLDNPSHGTLNMFVAETQIFISGSKAVALVWWKYLAQRNGTRIEDSEK